MNPPGIFGIVNVTRDSFSDGGEFLTADAAVAHAERLRLAGADVLLMPPAPLAARQAVVDAVRAAACPWRGSTTRSAGSSR